MNNKNNILPPQLFKILLFSLAFLSSPSFAESTNAEYRKVVFDLTTGNSERIESRIVGNIKYLTNFYKKQGIGLKAVVVISGESYKYFIKDLKNSPYKDDAELAKAQKVLAPLFQELVDKYDVRFDMCGPGMRSRKIKTELLYDYVHTDKMKYVYLINWQNLGYAYLAI